MKPVKTKLLAVLAISSALSISLLAPALQAQAQNSRAYPSSDSSSSRPGPATTSLATQNPLSGSVASGKATPEVLQLSLADAIARGLKQNLGLLLAGDSQIAAHGELWQQLSNLIPSLSGVVSENAQQVDLAAQGIGTVIQRQFPGFPLIVGPFGYFDVRARARIPLFNLSDWDNARSADRNMAAAKSSYQDIRELVVLNVAAAYLQAIAQSARVMSAEAQQATAQALYNQSVDLKNAGISAGIDVLRAQVEMQTRQQEVIAARNDFAKQKISLARMIGLPLEQSFVLSDDAPYQAPEPVILNEALQRAYAARADFQSALAQQRAAEYLRRAARDERLPSASAYADYGVIGPTPSQLHGTFTASVALNIPIFTGNRAHGDALVADAALERSKQRLENLRGQIDQDVRNAILDLQSASDQVQVAKSNVDLAEQTLTQARDRFLAGITDNLEVVQSQEVVASANTSYIASLYAYNLARVALARATGSAEQNVLRYWKEQ